VGILGEQIESGESLERGRPVASSGVKQRGRVQKKHDGPGECVGGGVNNLSAVVKKEVDNDRDSCLDEEHDGKKSSGRTTGYTGEKDKVQTAWQAVQTGTTDQI